MSDSQSRFALIEIDDAPAPAARIAVAKPSIVVSPAAVAAIAPVIVRRAPAHETTARAAVEAGSASAGAVRAVAQADIAASIGHGANSFRDGGRDGADTLFAYGTPLCESGAGTWRGQNMRHDAMPFATEAIGAFRGAFQAEARRDYQAPLSALRMTETGRIAVSGKGDGASVTRWALGQALARADAPAGALHVLAPSTGQHIAPTLRAELFNSYMTGADAGKRAKQTKLRTRTVGGKPQIFAVVSPRYTVLDALEAMESFTAGAHSTARGSVTYDGKRWRITASVRGHIEPTVGEIFEASNFLEGADDGSASITCGTEVVRARCLNLTVITSTVADSVRHNAADLRKRIGALIADSHKRLSAFADAWRDAQTAEICDDAAGKGVDKVFRLLCDKRLVHVAGVDAETMAERCFTAWNAEPGYSKAAMLNAITRAAHENTWADPWAPKALAEQAGQLLYQNVYLANAAFASIEG